MITILTMVFGFAVKLVPGLAGGFFKHLENKANSETERLRIRQVAEQQSMVVRADVIKTAMQYKVFWFAWSIIAFPFAGWLGLGFADSMFNGALPDVAKLPPQLHAYGDIVMGNLFISGGVVAAVQGGTSVVASTIARAKTIFVNRPEDGEPLVVSGPAVVLENPTRPRDPRFPMGVTGKG